MSDRVEQGVFAARRRERNVSAQMAMELMASLIYIRTGNAQPTEEEMRSAINALEPELREPLLTTINLGDPLERTDVDEFSDCLLPPDDPCAEPTLRFEVEHG